ncbi:MAG: hypothetical protein FJX74_17810, partial [Armatimonadetes bacterium]|nr:hypothetical protein [Armatimonadota bacterium]
MVRMATAAWLAGMVSLSAAQTTELALTLAAGERAWTTVAAGDARATWSGSGPTTEVTLTNGAGVVGRLDPTPTGLVDISLAVSAEGASELRVQFTDDPARAPVSALWTAEVSGAKAQRLAARLAPPAPAESPLYLYVGAKGDGTLRLSALALVSEALPPRLEAGPPPALPDGWEPAGYLDAQAREVAGATELLIEINGLQLSIEPETSCVLGGFAPLSAFILARGNTPRKLTLEGEFPAGIACDPREFSITKGGTSRAHLRVQGLLPGTHTGRVTARSGRESASFPLRVTVTRGYPSFGAAAGEPAGARRWQLREVVVRATPTSTLPELLDQAQPIL